MREAVAARGGDADQLVPVVNGGVSLSKTESVIHDTCAAANAAASLIVKRAEAARASGLSAEEVAALVACVAKIPFCVGSMISIDGGYTAQ